MKYANIVFLQKDSAQEAFDILINSGKDALFSYLLAWDSEKHHDLFDHQPWRQTDRTFKKGDYIVYYNMGLGYVGLSRIKEVRS